MSASAEEEGRALLEQHLDGGRCGRCGEHGVVRYRCSGCAVTWDFVGRYEWMPQGRGHFHVADMGQGEMIRTLMEHNRGEHAGSAVFLPEVPRSGE